MSTSTAGNTILEETARMQEILSDMEAELASKKRNPGGCSSKKVIVICESTILSICAMQIFLILQLIAISRVFCLISKLQMDLNEIIIFKWKSHRVKTVTHG